MIAVAAILKIYFEILLLYPKGELTQNVIKSRGHEDQKAKIIPIGNPSFN